MCLDNNTATLSVRYMNAQLHALWENAKECASHATYTDFKSSEYEKSRYTRALGEFHFLGRKAAKNLSTEDLFFFAKFAAPRLEFVCGHEAVLHLTIESGHLNLACKDAVKSNARADRQKNHRMDNLEIVFRVPFLRTNVKGRDEKIGNSEAKHLIQMIALQIKDARLLMYSPDESLSADVKDALSFYMKQYLQLLEHAGNHVFFDLPDFDDNKHRPVSNYALIHNPQLDVLIRKYSEDVKLLGDLDCNLLSKFYDMHWVTHSSQRNEHAWGKHEICLASICSDWIIGAEKNFFINFNKPIIQALCPHEVIVKFHIKELGFFKEAGICESSEPTHHYSDWKIAFIIDVCKPEGGALLQLDLETARFSRYHSYFGGERFIDVTVTEHINFIISFMQGSYLDIISHLQLHIVLGFPSVPNPPTYYSEDWSSTEEEEDTKYRRQHGHVQLWSERIETTIYGHYDQVIALSEASINLVLNSRHSACSTWRKDRFFSMDVHPLSIRLLSNGKAIVYVQAEGKIGVKRKAASTKFWIPWAFRAPVETDELEEYEFDTITLAYEVDLKMLAHDHLHESQKETITETKVKKTVIETFVDRITSIVSRSVDSEQTTTTRTIETIKETFHLMHLILDYCNARYVKELSEVNALGNGDEALERLATVQHYLPQYLHELTSFGHHILHTVPICKSPFSTNDAFAFTCVDFKVLTKQEVTIKTCTHGRGTTEMPLVLLYGMCTSHEMAQFVGSWLPGLIPVGGRAVGTLTLSSSVFLERCLLSPLKVINEATTIVPSSADIVNGVWLIDLCSWDHHKTRSQSKSGCAWKRAERQVAGFIAYEWEYCDDWSHSHRGNYVDEANGEYKLSSHTHNKLNIPTAFNSKGLEIVVSGKSEITLSGKTDNEKWTKTSTADWSATIKVDTTSGGLRVSIDYKAPCVNVIDEHPHCCAFDIASQHRTVMASKVADFEKHVLPKLRLAVEHTWKYSTMGIQTVSLRDPVFTRGGDLICELDLNKEAIVSSLLDKEEWDSHCHHIHAGAASNGASAQGQITYSSSKSSGNGYSQFGSSTSSFNLLQNISSKTPTTALSPYSVADTQHEHDSLSEDDEDHDAN